MKITTTLGPVAVISANGSLDSDSFPRLVGKTEEVFAQGCPNLILDLHDVSEISTGGLVALQTIAGRFASCGGRVVLSGLTRRVSQFMIVTGFTRAISIFPDVNTAQASFSARATEPVIRCQPSKDMKRTEELAAI